MRILIILITILSLAGPVQAWQVVGSGVTTATGIDETFNATGYDLGAAWTEVDTLGVVNPDSTTQAVSGQSLYADQNLTVTRGYTCYDYGSGASSRSITFKMYFDSLTLPAVNDAATIISLGSDNGTPDQTEGIIVQAVNLSDVLKVQGRGSAYGTSLDYSGIADTWVEVSIGYTQNGTTTITINGSSTNVTTPDVAARYLCIGGVNGYQSDEIVQIYFDDVDGL